MNQCDVSIIGAGVAGQTLALQIKKARPESKIIILEKARFPLKDQPIKVGESTVEISACYFSDVLGYENHLETGQLPKLGLRYFFPQGGKNNIAKRFEVGSSIFMPRRTYQIDRQRFEDFLYKECRRHGIVFEDGAYIRDLSLNRGGQALHAISYKKGERDIKLKSRWVVDASGRASVLQNKLKLKLESRHDVNAVWFRMKGRINIDDWSRSKAWKKYNPPEKTRWYSTNHLMDAGYWVWLIPLSRGSTSVGIVADPHFHPLSEMNSFEKAVGWLKKNEPQCAEAVLKSRSGLEDFLALKKFSKCSKQVYSIDRWALTGDSGIFIDPLYSPGMDYVAYSNTFITDFVTRDLDGKRVNGLVNLYNELFISLSENTFQNYQDNYQLFRNAQLSTLKIIWDFSVYWSFIAFIFNHGRSCDISLLTRYKDELRIVSSLHREMQEFFREWNKLKPREIPRSFVDLSKIKFLMNLNRGLVAKLYEREFEERLSENLILLKDLSFEMLEAAARNFPKLKKLVFKEEPSVKNRGYLKGVFRKLKLS